MTMMRLMLLLLATGVELVEAALSGDRRAVGRLVQRLMPIVRAMTRRVLQRGGRRIGPHDGDDLVQEVWMSLLRDDGRMLRRYDPSRGASFESYVALIARTEAGKVLRAERAQKRGGDVEFGALDDAGGISGGPDPEAAALGRSMQADLDRHLRANLPARGQLVLKLVYGDGLSAPDAARTMGVKTQVIYNWQHKIRGLIRERLAEVG